jgi:hypothetical protein
MDFSVAVLNSQSSKSRYQKVAFPLGSSQDSFFPICKNFFQSNDIERFQEFGYGISF